MRRGRCRVPTGERADAASVELRARIDDGVARIADGADPSLLDDALADLRDHDATSDTLDLAARWSNEAIAALAPLPDGAVRDALTRFARAVADRSS
jgi:heptaprenyl diphosphate synthase